MGSRCASWSLLGAALIFARTAAAEDIGREPLLPPQKGAQPEQTPGEAGGNSPNGPSGAELLSARGPSTAGADHGAAPKRHWYGWQTLIVDAVPALGLALTAAGSTHGDQSEALVVVFSAAYFVGGPIVHMAHGEFGKAALSLGIRSAGPLLIVAGNQDALQDTSGGAALIVIGVLAIPTAIAIDAAAIAREDVVKDESASILRRVDIAPWVDPKRGRAGLSVGFSF